MDDIKPKFIACLIDVSAHCSEEFLARCGGKVYLSGFYDDNLDTHCCSFTPMIDVTYMGYVAEEYPEDDEAREALHEELMITGADELGGYYTRRDLERVREAHPERFVALDIDLDSDEDEDEQRRAWNEQVYEYLSGNPVHA